MSTKHISAPRVLTTSLVSLLGLYSLLYVEAVAQSTEGRNGEYYWCHRAFPLSQGEIYYVSRILLNSKPTQHLDEAVGKAFVRHVLNLNPAINRKVVLDEEYNWANACWSSWPYGIASFKGPRDDFLRVGGKEIDWEYSPDKDLTVTPLTMRGATNGDCITSSITSPITESACRCGRLS